MKKILILEDNQMMQNILEKIVRKYFDDYNFQIIIEGNGESGIKALKSEITVDLIITDLNMTPMNGFDFIKSIKADNMWKTIPIIVASAMDDQVTMNRLNELGVPNFVSKPYDLKILTDMIQRMMDESEEAAFTTNLAEEVVDFIVSKSSLFVNDRDLKPEESKLIREFKDYLSEDLENSSTIRDLLLKYSPDKELVQNGQVMEKDDKNKSSK